MPWDRDDHRRADRLRLLLRQHHRGTVDERNVTDIEAFRRRHVLREQRARLDQLSTLFEGLSTRPRPHAWASASPTSRPTCAR